ncbi:hypothetical protein KR222_007094, partial [Zaprionus bogoriensis]
LKKIVSLSASKCCPTPKKPPKIGGVQFEKIGNKFYYIATDQRVNWFEARERCAALESHFASFKSKEEFNAVKNQLMPRIDYWIDFTNLGTGRNFYSTVDGRSPQFIDWIDGEPINLRENQNCGMVYYRTSRHQMNYESCLKKWAFICEYP